MGGRGGAPRARGSLRQSRVSPDCHPCRVRPVPRAGTARAVRGRRRRGRGRRGWTWESPLSALSSGGGSAPARQSERRASGCGAGIPPPAPAARSPAAPAAPHRPLSPPGPGTSAAKAPGPDAPRAGSSSRGRGGPQEHPNLRQLSAVVKRPPPPAPSSAFPPPEAAEKKSPQARSPRLVGDSGRGGPGPPSPVTCEDSDTDLMVVVSEDHSLGRHVSQRSHRTDRSREKPEPGARGPGARSPRRARERECPRSSRRAEKDGRRPGSPRPARGRGRAGSARVPGVGGGGRGRSQGARPRVRVGGGSRRVGVTAAAGPERAEAAE